MDADELERIETRAKRFRELTAKIDSLTSVVHAVEPAVAFSTHNIAGVWLPSVTITEESPELVAELKAVILSKMNRRLDALRKELAEL